MHDNIVIVGSGLAGYTLAREIRRIDKTRALTILTADQGDFYSKPLLSNALTQKKSADDLITTSTAQMAAQLDARIEPGVRVTAINPEQHTIITEQGEIGYASLALAVGAHPVKPDLAGNGTDAILTINNIDDYRQFQGALEPRHRVVIIGGGLIGCEFANDLANSGYHISVVTRGETPLDHLVPTQIGNQLMQALTELGVSWFCGTSATSVNRQNESLVIQLANGETLKADIIIWATGLTPDTCLAKTANLNIHRGIVVNALLETSARDIYALGDCAELNGQVLPYVMPLMNQARALAKTLTGTATAVTYPIMPVTVKTPAYPICVVPATETAGNWELVVDETGIKAYFNNGNGQLRGFVLGGSAVKEKNACVRQLQNA